MSHTAYIYHAARTPRSKGKAGGAMLVSIMLDELERRDLKRGMLSLCVGGGIGISTIIERMKSMR